MLWMALANGPGEYLAEYLALGHLAGAALVGSLTIVGVRARAQASTSLHDLRSANDGCWCSKKLCLDRYTATPKRQAHARTKVARRPEEAAGSGGHCDQPSRPLNLVIAFNLGYPFPKLHLGSAQCSQRLAESRYPFLSSR